MPVSALKLVGTGDPQSPHAQPAKAVPLEACVLQAAYTSASMRKHGGLTVPADLPEQPAADQSSWGAPRHQASAARCPCP